MSVSKLALPMERTFRNLRICTHQVRFLSSTAQRFASQSSDSDFYKHLPPYVQAPYSYAYGRSVRPLQYTTAGKLLTQRAQQVPDKLAVVCCSENLRKTFSQLEQDVNKLAASMYHELGIRRGHVIGNWGCNTYNWIVVEYAAARLGAIMCTINPVYKVLELEYALRKANIKALFMPGAGSVQEEVNKYTALLIDPAIAGGAGLPLEHIVTTDGGKPTAGAAAGAAAVHSLTDLMGAGANPLAPEVVEQVQADDPATIMFTSGTTGKPKGALNSHYTMVNNCLLLSYNLGINPLESNVSVMLPLPLFHSFALTLGTYAMSAMPFTVVLPHFRYDVTKIAAGIASEKCTHVFNTPTMLIDLLNYVEKTGTKLPSLTCVMAGGASVPPEVAKRVDKLIPSVTDVRIGYGSTESGPCATTSVPGDSPYQRMETVGKPLDMVEVKIVNPHNGEIVKLEETGELLTRGHNVMMGYFGDEEKTREAIDVNRWYHSGDLATMDKDGYIKIVGRTKEMLIRGGENVYPREIEELLHTHPDIYDVYIVGVPDERYGEEICAWVQLKDPKAKERISTEDIKKFCKEKLSYFKVPRYVMFVDGFPLTSTGKAQKFVMREKSCEILGLKEPKR